MSSKSQSDSSISSSSRNESSIPSTAHSEITTKTRSSSPRRTETVSTLDMAVEVQKNGQKSSNVILQRYTNREFLISEQKRLIDDISNRPQSSLNETTITASTFSTTSFAENASPTKVDLVPTNRINISDLKKSLNKPMYSKFLLCRTITAPIKTKCVMTVVDDPDTNTKNIAVNVALYNFLSQENEVAGHILPAGTLMAIKNPLFKSTGDGSFLVCCENPTEVRIFSEKTVERKFPTAQWKTEIPFEFQTEIQSSQKKVEGGKDDVYWKALGEYLLQKCRYTAALEAYDKSLEQKPYDTEAMSKLSEIFLRVKNYDKCLNNALGVLEHDPLHETAFFHKIHSLIGLRQYEDAVNSLQWLIKHHKKNKNINPEQLSQLLKLLKKAKLCELHQKTGKYDLSYILKCPRTHLHDCGEYIGPVEIVLFDSKGRGTVARKAIPAGTIIHCTKAFAMGYPDDNANSLSDSQVAVNSNKSDYTLNSPFHKLVTQAASRIMNDPESGKIFYKLYAGPDLKWLDSNSDDVTEEQVTSVDMKRIDAICTFNAFYGDAGEMGENDRCCGVWTISSFINHSCFDSNCTWRMHGDLLIIRATRDIAKGEEITTTYISPCELYDNRKQTFSSYGFQCKCSLCLVDEEESYEIHQRRRHFLRKFEKIDENAFKVANTVELIKTLEFYIEELIELRPSNPHLNIYIVNPLHQLASYYFVNEEYIKAANILKHAHGIVSGTVLIESALSCSINIVNCYIKARHIAKAKKAAKILERDLFTAYGKSASMELLSSIAEEADLVQEMKANNILLEFPKND